MHIPPDDGAGQQGSRRRDRGTSASVSGRQVATRSPLDRHDDGSDSDGQPAGPPVFAPDYDSRRPDSAQRSGVSGAHTAPPSWYGSAADGAAGKGPVHGYPPVPGQPPPMYPPGQFAAWNRGVGRHRPPAQDGGDSAGQPGWQAARLAAEGGAGTSGYYNRDITPGAEPGYSTLAVSDPAADVTSTQTWRAVEDGRATGTWTAPARPDSEPGTPGSAPARSAIAPGRTSAEPARPSARLGSTSRGSPVLRSDDGPGLHGSTDLDAATGLRGSTYLDAATGLHGRPGLDTATGLDSTPDQDGTQGRDGRQTRQAAGQRSAQAGQRAHGVPASSPRRLARSHGGAHTGPLGLRRPGRSRPSSVRVAMICALLLVLAAAAALSYAVLRTSARPKALVEPSAKASTTASASPTASLGPYGHIASRSSDPEPLTVAQLYPVSFAAGTATVTRTASNLSTNCDSNVDGANIQAAITTSGCSQVVRATYLSPAEGLMGTIGVLNLRTASAAKTAVQSADASDFISQLTGPSGPTHKIGQGTGIEQAAAKGHYLILIWAEFTDLRKPKNAAQTAQIENFMTELLDNTANISLSNRMLTGSP